MRELKRITSLFLIISIVMTFGMTVIAEQTTPAVTISAASSTYVAGETAEFNATITSNQIIDKAELYVNGEFHSVKYNCGTDFIYYYPVPRDAAQGVYSCQMKAYDVNNVCIESNIVNIEISENSPMTISFIDLPSDVKLMDFNEIKAEISDNDGVAKTELYINDKLSDAVCTSHENNTYVFTDFEKNIGNMKIEIKATDGIGVISSKSQDISVDNLVIKPHFTHTMDTVTIGSTFTTKLNDTGHEIVLDSEGDKCLIARRHTAVPSVKNALMNYLPGSLSGIIEYGFKFKYMPGFENTMVTVELNSPSLKSGYNFITRLEGSDILNNSGISSSSKEDAGVFSDSDWHTVKYTFDTSKAEYQISIDDRLDVGGVYPLSLASGKTALDAITGIKLNIYLPDVNDALKISELYSKKEVDVGKISTVTYPYDENKLSVTVANAMDTESLDGNVRIYSNDELIPISSVIYDTDTQSVVITPAKPLASSVDYYIELGEDVIEAGDKLGSKSISKLSIPCNEFDIRDLTFIESNDSLGVSAMVSNNTEADKSLVMLMTLYDENDVLQSVVPSMPAVVSAGAVDTNITIAPVYSKGVTAKVFFLDNWTNNIAAKPYIYTN